MSKWELYDALIESIPSEARVEYCCRGTWQSYVETQEGAGLASLLLTGRTPYSEACLWDRWHSRSLRDLAALWRSWEPQEAALGTAALTAWHTGRQPSTPDRDPAGPPQRWDVFQLLRRRCQDKTVSVVGHFRGAECLRETAGRFLVFEREPREGDYPDTAEEFLLPGSDVVILTGMTLTNKTLPRLLELAQGAFVAVTGPSVPLAPLLFSFGVDALFSMTVRDTAACRQAVRSPEGRTFLACVEKTELWRDKTF